MASGEGLPPRPPPKSRENALTGNTNRRAVVIPVPIAVAIMIPILRRRECGEGDEKKNCEDENDFRQRLATIYPQQGIDCSLKLPYARP